MDVALQPLGESPNRLAAMESGQVNAVILDLAQAVEAERLGGRILLAAARLPDLPISGLSVTETKLRDQTPQVEAMVRASVRGLRFLGENGRTRDDHDRTTSRLSRDVAETTYDLGVGSFAAGRLILTAACSCCSTRPATPRPPQRATAAQIADFSHRPARRPTARP